MCVCVRFGVNVWSFGVNSSFMSRNGCCVKIMHVLTNALCCKTKHGLKSCQHCQSVAENPMKSYLMT